MIRYYTKKEYLPKDKEFIEFIDGYFRSWVFNNGLDSTDEKLMRLIDKSTLSEMPGVIITPYGATSYYNISTGCKALILLTHLEASKVVINIQECGQNVIDYIFSNLDDINIYSSAYKDLKDISKHNIEINNELLTSYSQLRAAWR